MEAPEVPTEHLHEHLEHAAEHGGERWTLGVALSSALLAALAAVASLMAGKHSNEGMIAQLKASDTWAYYQSKSIKVALLKSKIETQAALGRAAKKEDKDKLVEDGKKMEELQKEAGTLEAESHEHLEREETFARAVTLFQIAIALGAIAALTRRKPFWLVSLAFGAGGIGFLLLGLLRTAG